LALGSRFARVSAFERPSIANFAIAIDYPIKRMSSAQGRLTEIKSTIAPTPTPIESKPMSVPIDNEIKGKLALITGASGG
jgi:hypothetical protein